MLRSCRSLAWIAATFVALAFGVAAAPAQTGYPDRPVKIIVPIGPGGSYDLVGRHLADVLSKRTGQTFFVENSPAPAPLSVRSRAQSEPDGYALVGGPPTYGVHSALYSNLAYNPPGFRAGRWSPIWLCDGQPARISTADDIVGHRRGRESHPGSITVATAGVGPVSIWWPPRS
jgi:hypothetical protein